MLAQLKAGDVHIEFTSWRGCELQLLWMSPAKVEGFCEISLFNPTTNNVSAPLFDAKWSNLDWLRDQAERIARALNISVEEVDLGAGA